MRLLYREDGQLHFIDRDASIRYAILSHTWDRDEVTYTDVLEGRSGHKLEFALQQAERDGLRYVWIDSCCIDRRHGPELGEAINSMFKWYAEAEVCYAYLADVPEKEFVASRWHTRGWTLQELLAPDIVRFYDCNATYLGDRSSLASDILIASGIEIDVPLSQVSFADRMRWSEKRQTSKPEDACYCMVGLMEISLIFNYGEGAEVARARLTKAVRKRHGVRTSDALYQEVPDDPCDSEKSLEKALAFDGMRMRHQAISSPYTGTCEWISKVKEYQEWLAGTRRMIWIKGRPGTGKSTLVKHIEDCAPGISFYFNARGGALEHSVTGMYRSLLFQLMDYGISKQILTYVRKQIRDRLPWLAQLSLQQTFQYAVGLLAASDPIRCYVDALDECDQQEVQQMVHLLEGLNLHVCFASRHYPAIVIRSASIEMAGNDITTFVDGRLVPHLADEVIRKANGIFFWAVIVVDMLNDGHVKGIRKDISALPGTLDGLLEVVIDRDEEKERFELAMCLILYNFTGRMQLYEFCGFMKLGALVKLSDRRAFVHNVTRGLASVVDAHIQPLHETVREVMFKTWSRQHPDVDGWAHERLARLCTSEIELSVNRRYTRSHALRHIDHSSSPGSFLQRPGLHKVLRLDKKFDSVNRYNVVQWLLLQSCMTLLEILLSLTDATQEALLEPAMRFTAQDLDLRHEALGGETILHMCVESEEIAAAAGLELLLRHGADMEQADSKGRTALLAASGCSYHIHHVSLLVQHGADIHARDLQGRSVLHYAFCSEVVEILIAAGADPTLRDQYDRSAIEHHIELYNDKTAKAILKYQVPSQDTWKQRKSHVLAQFTAWTVKVAAQCRLSPDLIAIVKTVHERSSKTSWTGTCLVWWWDKLLSGLEDLHEHADPDLIVARGMYKDRSSTPLGIRILKSQAASGEIKDFVRALLDRAWDPRGTRPLHKKT